MLWIYAIGEIQNPSDASRFGVPNICYVIHVALEIVSGWKGSHYERVFVPFRGVRFSGFVIVRNGGALYMEIPKDCVSRATHHNVLLPSSQSANMPPLLVLQSSN